MPALSAALAVALSARTGALTLHMVDDLRTKAEELLPRADPLRAAVLSFATRWEAHRHDAGAVLSLGETLQAALDAALAAPPPAPPPDPATWPDPVDAGRADIYG
jgi:hypothetical protein